MLPTSSSSTTTTASLQVNQFNELQFNALDRRSSWQQQRSQQRSFKQSLSAICKSILNLFS